MKPGQGITGRNELSVWEEVWWLAKATRVSRLWAGQSSATQALGASQASWAGVVTAVGSLSHVLRLRQAVEGEQVWLSRVLQEMSLGPRSLQDQIQGGGEPPGAGALSSLQLSSPAPGPRSQLCHTCLLLPRPLDQTKVVTHAVLPTSSFSHEPPGFLCVSGPWETLLTLVCVISQPCTSSFGVRAEPTSDKPRWTLF